jgi:hypothetical protein
MPVTALAVNVMFPVAALGVSVVVVVLTLSYGPSVNTSAAIDHDNADARVSTNGFALG